MTPGPLMIWSASEMPASATMCTRVAPRIVPRLLHVRRADVHAGGGDHEERGDREQRQHERHTSLAPSVAAMCFRG